MKGGVEKSYGMEVSRDDVEYSSDIDKGTQPRFPLPNPRDPPDTPTNLRKHLC